MRELLGPRSVKAAGSCVLAGTLVLSLYVFSTPGRSIETRSAPLAGHARVIDGDTIEIAGRRIRLEGIDAPETAQRCPHRWSQTWPAGRHAARVLARMIAGQVVSCRRRGRDAYGRLLAACRVGDLELNSEMVRRGLAWAFVRYSRRYVAVERQARAARVGIWQRPCTPAWIYRRARWQS